MEAKQLFHYFDRSQVEKKIIVTDETYFVSIRLLTVKDNIHTDLRISHSQFLSREENSGNKILS